MFIGNWKKNYGSSKKAGTHSRSTCRKGEVTTQFVSYAESGKRAMRPENLLVRTVEAIIDECNNLFNQK